MQWSTPRRPAIPESLLGDVEELPLVSNHWLLRTKHWPVALVSGLVSGWKIGTTYKYA